MAAHSADLSLPVFFSVELGFSLFFVPMPIFFDSPFCCHPPTRNTISLFYFKRDSSYASVPLPFSGWSSIHIRPLFLSLPPRRIKLMSRFHDSTKTIVSRHVLGIFKFSPSCSDARSDSMCVTVFCFNSSWEWCIQRLIQNHCHGFDWSDSVVVLRFS